MKAGSEKKLELATATVSPFLRVEKSANAEPEPAPASLSSDTGLSIETEKYYAVDYVNQFYIGRVLLRSDREGYWQMKFLHQYTRNGKVRFRWPRAADYDDVHQSAVICGPVELEGVDDFKVTELDNIKTLFNQIRKSN